MTYEGDEKFDKKATPEEVLKAWNDNLNIVTMPIPKRDRVVDQYDRKSLNDHLARFAQHAAAKGIQPTVEVIIDWLYSKKAFDERDDFVTIERLMEMVGHNQVYPLLIMEVLAYAKKLEDAAIQVHDQLGHMENDFKSLENLNKALEYRLYRREDDAKKSQLVKAEEAS